ncbi:MAG: ABC transporter ATP-binding protein [Thermoanaerobaculia bacterium]
MITVCNLTKSYGSSRGVMGVSLTVGDAEIVAIVGPNGAGKTTLVKVLGGLATQDAGSFQISPSPRDDAQEGPDVGVMPEVAPLFDLLTGREHLEFLGDIWRLPIPLREARIGELEEALGLDGALNRLVGHYSKGMRQKLAFAAAVMSDPRVLILDEPFEGVDPVSVKTMKEILLQFRRAGASVIVTSHMLDVISEIFDRVFVLCDGTVQFSGDRRQLDERVRQDAGEFPAEGSDLERLYIGLVAPSRAARKLTTMARAE